MKSLETICITGVNGFLGSATAAAFIEAGYHVLGIGTTPQPAATVPAAVTYQAVDINDTSRLIALLKEVRVDVVYHFAAIKYVGVCEAEPDLCRHVNYQGTISVLAAMAAAHVPHLVFSSTYAVYDLSATTVVLDELSPCRPSTVYGKSKRAAEEAIVAAAAAGEITTYQILRYGNVIGRTPSQFFAVESIVDRIVEAALTGTTITLYGDAHDTKDGSLARDFVAVSDVVRAHLAVVNNENSGIYNIAAGHAVTLREIISIVETVTGKKMVVEIQPTRAESDSITIKSDAAYHAFGWRAEALLSETIKRLVQAAQSTAR